MEYLLLYADGVVTRRWFLESEMEAHNLIEVYAHKGYERKKFWLFPLEANVWRPE